MKTKYFNWPIYLKPQDYERAIAAVLNSLADNKELLGLFQIGSVSDPGISDIDLVAVFADDYATQQDPLAVLDKKLRYLFPHGVFAISRSHFQEYRRFLFHFKFNKLFGKLHETSPVSSLKPEEESILKNQIAMEFLFLNYMKKEIESAYRMVDVRGTLLSAKAILFDLDFLGMNDSELTTLIQQLIAWRKQWFASTPRPEIFDDWNQKLIGALRTFMTECLKGKIFYLPNAHESIRYARHIQIKRADFAKPERKGFAFLLPLMPINKKYFRLWHRLNQFIFSLPWKKEGIPEILNGRFTSAIKLKEYQIKHFPLYSPLIGNIQKFLG
jgi:hypothetical protein